MPKIEVNSGIFYKLCGRSWKTKEEFVEALTCAKAELDSDFITAEQPSVRPGSADESAMKIELNDTNRPDLWSTAGCARQLRVYNNEKIPQYGFFSSSGNSREARYRAFAEKSTGKVRPFLTGFVASGVTVTDPMLRDIIQTQEKLAWNYGRKRRTVSMGIYRSEKIKWPIVYRAVDPASVSFVPLQWDSPLTPAEILKKHPKGKEYAFILENEPLHPLLLDSQNNILSYPPIINSADLGAVETGDSNLFVEFTGTDLASVILATSIVACDMADSGFTIEPLEVEYENETPLGKKIVTPYYFQKPVFCSLARIEKFLGKKLNAGECISALERMGVNAEITEGSEQGSSVREKGVTAKPPEYRNDYLHAADIGEDIMIGHGLHLFTPERPNDFTVGRLQPLTLFCRQVKEIMTGLGYQEMIYNYLGSRRDYVEKMRSAGDRIIRIANPMTENYEYVRDSILASLMESESVSGHSVYPHRIFETGKIAYLDDADNSGSVSRLYLGFLFADREANFNNAAAQIQTLFYYLSREYSVAESSDPRFIAGRAASVMFQGKSIGVYGEIHPQVLENWGVTMPCIAAEIDIEALAVSEK